MLAVGTVLLFIHGWESHIFNFYILIYLKGPLYFLAKVIAVLSLCTTFQSTYGRTIYIFFRKSCSLGKRTKFQVTNMKLGCSTVFVQFRESLPEQCHIK